MKVSFNCNFGWKCVSARLFWVPWKWHFRDKKMVQSKCAPKLIFHTSESMFGHFSSRSLVYLHYKLKTFTDGVKTQLFETIFYISCFIVGFQMSPQMTSLRGCIVTIVAFDRLFPNVCFRMSTQTACIRRCIVTSIAFIWLFSTVPFQMYPQIVNPNRCIVTLVAFVWFFSTVHFQMYLQTACMNGCKVTLIAFVCLFSTVYFQMCHQNVFIRGWIITLVAFV